MTKQLDKLVEDIASVFCPNCVNYDVSGKQCGLWREVLECENATLPAGYAVDRVLEAVRDGMPLPGEKSRKLVGTDRHLPNNVGPFDILIALSPSGTGKEEKK